MKFDDLNVLFVDDEENILKSIKRGLIDEPYIKLFAESGAQALKIINSNEIALLVTDMRMPEMSGMELLKKVQEISPRTVRIILTGYSQVSTLLNAINQGRVFRYLTKPWKMETDFIPAINQGLEYYLLLKEREEMIRKLKNKNMESNKQNLKITSLFKEMEKSNQRKDHIFNYLSQEIEPFLSEVVEFASRIINADGSMRAGEIKKELENLSEKGTKSIELLKKVENLLRDDKWEKENDN